MIFCLFRRVTSIFVIKFKKFSIQEKFLIFPPPLLWYLYSVHYSHLGTPVPSHCSKVTFKMPGGKYWYSDSDFQRRLSDSERLVGGGHYGSGLPVPTELPQKNRCIDAYRNNSRCWLSETRMNESFW